MSRPSFDPGFSTEELTAIYGAEATVSALLEFEAALAMALAEAGIAPADEAEQVAERCRQASVDPDSILASTWDAGTPIIALREAVDAGEWFHHGATTQDAVDTGQMIQAKRALEALETPLASIGARLRDLSEEHRHQPQMGRTFLQNARPTTFGFRTAMWLDSVIDVVVDLRSQRSALTVQLGGPVGTRDAYGPAGRQVIEDLANRLGLKAPTISWHSDRGRILSLGQAVARASTTMAKIGSDIAHLSASSVGEISVRSGSSSSMPGKENPIDSTRAIAAAAACTGAVAMLTSAPPHELDRAVGAWHVEWVALPVTFQTGGAAIEAIEVSLSSLEVDTKRMAADVETVDTDEQIDQVLARYEETL